MNVRVRMVSTITNGLGDKIGGDGIERLLGLAFPFNYGKAMVRRGKLDSCQIAAYFVQADPTFMKYDLSLPVSSSIVDSVRTSTRAVRVQKLAPKRCFDNMVDPAGSTGRISMSLRS
jgi:hypothetical protein